MGSENRFAAGNPLYDKNDFSPGPAAYTLQGHKSICTSATTRKMNPNGNISMGSLNKTPQQFSTFGSTHDKYKNVYHKENVKAFNCRLGPGPAGYDQETFHKTTASLSYSFPKNDRGVKLIKVKKAPSPVDFRHEEAFKKVIKKDLMVKMGKAKREVDFTKCKHSSHL